uniref:Uncharacterized protein n=1 Tax=Clonostachys rogersoniana TaxID=122658 RepID=A0A8F1Y2I2_CLORO|nr:hypothetical protein [Clonostachys rogersoniana]
MSLLCASYIKKKIEEIIMKKIQINNSLIYNIILKSLIIFFIGLLGRSLINLLINLETFKVSITLIYSSIIFTKIYLCLENIMHINSDLYTFNNNPRNSKLIDLRYNKSLSNNNCLNNNNLNLKIKDEIRCQIHWRLVGQFTSKYNTYYEFKDKWDIDMRLVDFLKKEARERKDQLILQKRTLFWILRRRNN